MSTFKSIDKGKQRASFKDTTLILPIVSLANVAQLASDLLVHSLPLELVGRLTSRYHIPIVGPRDYVEGRGPLAGISTPVEVFQSKDGSITLVQQRSPVIKSQKEPFIKALSTFIKEEGFTRVLLLAGVDAGLRQDFDNPFRYLTTPNATLSGDLKAVMTAYEPTSPDLQASHLPLMPSSGITRRLLSGLLENNKELEVSAILMYVAEGDNRYDAHVLARAVDKVLQLHTPEQEWKEPVSWDLGLYGVDKVKDGTAYSGDLYG